MPAGRYDTPVDIESATQSQSVGEPSLTWSTFASWWAEKRLTGGGESAAGGQAQYATAQHQWRGRYISGVLPGMRLNQSGTLFDIDVVDDTDRRLKGEMLLVTTQRSIA